DADLVQVQTQTGSMIAVVSTLMRKNSIDGPRYPALGSVTRWLSSQWVPTVAVRGRNVKIVAFRTHTLDYVTTSRVIHVDGIIALVKAVGFRSASNHIFGVVWQTPCEEKYG